MLFLVFQLEADRYAIEASQIVAVLPLLQAKAIPQAPAGVAGLFDYHGEAVPLIDLSRLALGRDAAPRLSTRVVVVRYPLAEGGWRKLGLIAEQVVETVRLQADAFAPGGVDTPQARYLGPVAADAHGLLQWVEVEHLLPPSVRDLLFQSEAETA